MRAHARHGRLYAVHGPSDGSSVLLQQCDRRPKWAEDVDAAGVAVEMTTAPMMSVANDETTRTMRTATTTRMRTMRTTTTTTTTMTTMKTASHGGVNVDDDGEDDSEMEAHEEAHFKAMLASPEGQRTLAREMETVGRHERRREQRHQSKARVASRRAEDDDGSATESDNSDEDPERGARKRARGRGRRRAADDDSGWFEVALSWTRRILSRGASNAKFAGSYAGVFISEVARLVWQEEGHVDALADARVPLTGEAAPPPSPAAPAVVNPIAGSP